MKSSVPALRIREVNASPVNPKGDFVLYWMVAFRRIHWNFSLQRAVDWARELGKPLLILEALRIDYPWASDRFHRFILDGMKDNALDTANRALYYPFVETWIGQGKGLLAALGGRACVTVTDDFPCFFIPRMVEAAARKLDIRLEQVDSNGLLPLRRADRAFTTAYAFRRFLQKTLPGELLENPEPDPLSALDLKPLPVLPKDTARKWPMATPDLLKGNRAFLRHLPMDHEVEAADLRGGACMAREILATFLKHRLAGYPERRNQPDIEGTSGLSPFLHFGHLSVHQIFHLLSEQEKWHPGRLSERAAGGRTGWWGMSEPAEAFLDQLVTWREVGFNLCGRRADYDRYESLPDWALKSLAAHKMDRRPFLYDLEAFKGARTHDPLWNAAQGQLLREGRMHNYLRMLWGKKILEWSPSPEKALKTMIELNNRYALDGRDPNSYSGIFWVLGRYDRAWGPERPVFGKVRYMSSENTARKFRVRDTIKKYGGLQDPI